MGGKKALQVVFSIDTPEEFEQKTSAENDKVAVIDFHLDWCGPCTQLEPSFRLMYFNIEDAKDRVEFLTAGETVYPEGTVAKMGLTCKPRICIYKGGKKEVEIDGVKLTEIESNLMDLLPSLDD